ncbi:hypothetical protein FOCC_FOCC009647, partial [Frankliniella occidentalis]
MNAAPLRVHAVAHCEEQRSSSRAEAEQPAGAERAVSGRNPRREVQWVLRHLSSWLTKEWIHASAFGLRKWQCDDCYLFYDSHRPTAQMLIVLMNVSL